MKKYIYFILAAILLVVLVFSGCSSEKTTSAPATSAAATTTQAQQKVIELSYNINYNATQIPGKVCYYFADQLNKRSNGQLQVTVYPAGTLSDPAQVYQSVVDGIADFGQHTVTYTPGRFLEVEAAHLPYNFSDGWVSTRVNTDFINEFKPASLNDTHFFFAVAPGPYELQACTNTPAIHIPADLKGKKMRVTGATGTAFVEAYGGTAVGITMNEAYDAASKGVFDIIIAPPEALKGWNFADVVSSMTMVPYGYCTANMLVMNKDKWASLPQDMQDLVNTVAAECVDYYGYSWWYSDIIGMDHLASMGKEIIYPEKSTYPDWEAPLQGMINKYYDDAEAAGLPGEEYYNYVKERGQYYMDNHTAQKDEMMKFIEDNVLNISTN
jgi:TRAP-type C4-dicarboxylate transport system substrate-binding protein